MGDDALVRRADGYLHAAPVAGADPEDVGPFTLFRPTGALPYYARPTPGAGEITGADVVRLGRRCAELGLPASLEWVVETAPSVGSACIGAGWHVVEHPLLALEPVRLVPATPPPGVEVSVLPADPVGLKSAWAVIQTAFTHPGAATDASVVAVPDDVLIDDALVAALTERTARGVTVTAVAHAPGGVPLAAGQHQPVGATTEVVAVATLPAHRRRGLAAAVVSVLVGDAATRGADLVLLSAGDDDAARLYQRLGFHRIGSVGTADPS